MPSSDVLKSGKAFNAACTFIDATKRLSEKINLLIEAVDPKFYKDLRALQKEVNRQYAGTRTLSSIDPLVLDGREVLFNKLTAEHTDSQDPQLGWAVLFAAGSFTGGYLVVKALGLRIRLHPGDLVMLRGRVLKHKVEVWEGGDRISIPHFTHSSVWRRYGMSSAVSVGEEDLDPVVVEEELFS